MRGGQAAAAADRAPADALPPDRPLPHHSVSQPLPRFKRGTRDPF